MNSNLEIVVKAEDFSNVSFIGDIDILTSKCVDDFLENVIENYKTNLTIDCEKLTYIDSCGMNILVRALERMKQCDTGIYLVNMNRSIKRLFEISGLDNEFLLKC